MSKSTYINAECVDGDVTIRSGGKGIDLLILSAMVFCSTLDSKLKKGCADSDRMEIAHGLIDKVMEKLKTKEKTIITLPGDFLTEK
ncbi:hypothetical protein [uncultured Gemmiger sp.]|jgi:hypothetical protein|uniref:hypothetical protein n=1 Tax=uncultured Gemmiger sp. TaxID=1623490 RepID=UPI002804E462|nr:hypothetical protein [uncultured Gemmiger sp.]